MTLLVVGASSKVDTTELRSAVRVRFKFCFASRKTTEATTKKYFERLALTLRNVILVVLLRRIMLVVVVLRRYRRDDGDDGDDNGADDDALGEFPSVDTENSTMLCISGVCFCSFGLACCRLIRIGRSYSAS